MNYYRLTNDGEWEECSAINYGENKHISDFRYIATDNDERKSVPPGANNICQYCGAVDARSYTSYIEAEIDAATKEEIYKNTSYTYYCRACGAMPPHNSMVTGSLYNLKHPPRKDSEKFVYIEPGTAWI